MNWLAVLRAIAPKGKSSILASVAEAMPMMADLYRINTPRRQAQFLAQLAHESAGFKTTTEYASGKAYEGRRDLGNTEPGDGMRFKGRGLIQVTGRFNYQAASKALGVDLITTPGAAALFPFAILTAGWYWEKHNLNAWADKDDVERITRIINGGLNGFADRKSYLAKAKAAIAKEAAAPVARPVAVEEPKPAPAPVESPAKPSPSEEQEKPWWEKSPILRQLINTVSALGITGAAVFDLPPWLIGLLAVLIAAVSIYAITWQTKRAG
jgi:putative chitinase